MPRVRLSRSAERWFLARIAELAEIDPQAARRLIERLERHKTLLSTFPSMTEQGLIKGTRKVSMPPLVLTIRLKDGVIEIAAIRDGRQKDALAPEELQQPDDHGQDTPSDDQ
jgi:plasmid stabilization system protein ParE